MTTVSEPKITPWYDHEDHTPSDKQFNEIRAHLQNAHQAQIRGAQKEAGDATVAAAKALDDLQIQVRSELAEMRAKLPAPL